MQLLFFFFPVVFFLYINFFLYRLVHHTISPCIAICQVFNNNYRILKFETHFFFKDNYNKNKDKMDEKLLGYKRRKQLFLCPWARDICFPFVGASTSISTIC